MNPSTTIFNQYAGLYDLIYHDKNYAAEALFVANLIKKFSVSKETSSILDLACGTGRHAEELYHMGFLVDASDLSADMIHIAQDRAKQQKLAIHFYNESFQTSHLIQKRYDTIIAMFSAIDYLTHSDDLTLSLKNIRGLLKEKGLFIFDFWNGHSVSDQYSPTRIKQVTKGTQTITRHSKTTLDSLNQLAIIHFNFVLSESGQIIHEFSEEHQVRYFFPEEMKNILEKNGFQVIHQCPFLKIDHTIQEKEDWNLTYVVTPQL